MPSWLPSAELFAWLFGAGTVVLAVGVSVPQFVRLVRTRAAAGVSLPAATNSAISFVAWTGYAVHLHDPWLIASSAIGVPFAVATAAAAWRFGAVRAGLWLPAVWIGVLCVAAGLQVAGVAALTGGLVGASILWLVLPAVGTAWLSPDVSGISPGAWLMLAVEGLLFLGYGVSAQVGASVLYGLCALVGAGAVLARLPLGVRRAPAVVRIPVQVPVRVSVQDLMHRVDDGVALAPAHEPLVHR